MTGQVESHKEWVKGLCAYVESNEARLIAVNLYLDDFDGYPDVTLDLVESRTFDGRLQLLEYVPTVLDRPPGVGDWPE
jgi:hypothetical protein